MKISEKKQDNISESDIPFRMLKKLIMLCLTARESELEYINSRKRDKLSQSRVINWNPMDVFMIIFQCCDPFLKQELVRKMFTCRLAIPFLYRNTNNKIVLSKWSLRGIDVNLENRYETNIVCLDTKIISFVRTGKLTNLSKSNLLNSIINASHATFFWRECRFGKTKRVIAEGCVEASWFIPSKSLSSWCSDLIMTLNLRGNFLDFEKQFEVLCKLSSMFIIHTPVDYLTNKLFVEKLKVIHSFKKKIICVFDCDEIDDHVLEEFKNQFREEDRERTIMIDLGEMGISDLVNDLRCFINEELRDLPSCKLEKCLAHLPSSLCEDDENINIDCKKGKEQALKVICNLPSWVNEEKESIKTTSTTKKEASEKLMQYLPKRDLLKLQGPDWKEWCSLKRKKLKAKYNDSDCYICTEFDTIRKKQTQTYLEKSVPFLNDFLDSFYIEDEHITRLKFFLSWLKYYIDGITQMTMPTRIQKYQQLWKQLKVAKDEIETHEINELRIQFNDSEQKLLEASFGIEHVIREVGQIYEAIIEKKSTVDAFEYEKVKKFPKVMSKLIQSGYPFEILDGDTSMIPSTWINAVLREMKNDLNDKKILTLAVLGIQSSGKSTLLNALFGLQFSVRAGSCTKGVFIQLVEVEKGYLPYDFVLVIDTEGLRSTSIIQNNYDHDNELATFVLGLAQLTIINIKGENTNEMKDCLEIAVHAFLRLKMTNPRIDVCQTCVFVHQNVPSANASTHLSPGNIKLIEVLDGMTEAAAKQLGIADIKSFNQVLQTDLENLVFHFSDLWSGDPPMAHANQGYSIDVANLKEKVFDIEQTKCNNLFLSQLSLRIDQLWKGIMSDDFVYSFRNSLEIQAFNVMEDQYQGMILETADMLQKFIRSTVRLKFAECEIKEKLSELVEDLKAILRSRFQICLNKLVTDWYNFIDKNPSNAILVQWKESRVCRLREEVDRLIRKGDDDIQTVQKQYALTLIQRFEQDKHEKEIQKKSMRLAEQYRGKRLSGVDLRSNFDEMWQSWISGLQLSISPSTKSINAEIDKILYDFTKSDDRVLLPGEMENAKKIEKIFERMTILAHSIMVKDIKVDRDISLYLKTKAKKEFKRVCKNQAVTVINGMFKVIDDKVKELLLNDDPFDQTYAMEILRKLHDQIRSHNENKNYDFKFTAKLRVRLYVHVACFMKVIFTKADEAYQMKHNVKVQMQKYQTSIWKIFKSTVDEKSTEFIVACNLCEKMKDFIKTSVNDDLPEKIRKIIYTEEFTTKYVLTTRIMADLAKNGKFENIQSYIEDPERFAFFWVMKYASNKMMNEHVEGQSRYELLADSLISSYVSSIKSCLDDATQKIMKSDKKKNIHTWIKYFHKYLLSKDVPISKVVLTVVEDIRIKDYSDFKRLLHTQLDLVRTNLIGQFANSADNFIDHQSHIQGHKILEYVWGCNERCPFCGETCQNSSKVHKGEPHTCIQHRPLALEGVSDQQTGLLRLETCSYLITSKNCEFFCDLCKRCCQKSGKCDGTIDSPKKHLFREYRKFIPEWDIPPSMQMDSSDYWMYILHKYKDNFVMEYDAELPDSLAQWENKSQKEAIGSLNVISNIRC